MLDHENRVDSRLHFFFLAINTSKRVKLYCVIRDAVATRDSVDMTGAQIVLTIAKYL